MRVASDTEFDLPEGFEVQLEDFEGADCALSPNPEFLLAAKRAGVKVRAGLLPGSPDLLVESGATHLLGSAKLIKDILPSSRAWSS